MFCGIVLLALIAAAFYTDVTRMIIPNILTIPAILAGLFAHAASLGFNGFLFSLAGMLTGFGVTILLYWIGGLGGGDVKLFAAVGALTGVEFSLYSLLYSVLYAGLIGMFLLLWKKIFFQHLLGWLLRIFLTGKGKRFLELKAMSAASHRFPFMYAVVPGIVTAGLTID